MAVMDEDLQRLWHLLAELSSQLTQNKEQCEQLKKQAEDLKTQAIHTGTGYALKRFNVDLSKEQFESEVERMNAQLVVENQTLQHENRQLTILLKDHETTLEQIMTRFRTHAHSTQQHELEMTKYYESQLLMEKQQRSMIGMSPNLQSPYDPINPILIIDPNVFQAIQNISILIQRAMRDLSGEEPFFNELDEFSDRNREQDYSIGTSPSPSPSGAISELSPGTQLPGHQNTTSSLDPGTTQATPSPLEFKNPFNAYKSLGVGRSVGLPNGPSQTRRSSTSIIEYQPRLQDPSRGGFVGKRNGSLSDAALQTAIEVEGLKKENEQLRELLGIANDMNLQTGESSESRTSQDAHTAKLNSVVEEVIKEEEEEEEEEGEEEEGEVMDESNDRDQWLRESDSNLNVPNLSEWSDDEEPIESISTIKSEEELRSSTTDLNSIESLTELANLSLSDTQNSEIPIKVEESKDQILKNQIEKDKFKPDNEQIEPNLKNNSIIISESTN